MLSFPSTINPVIVSFGPLAVSWYSLSYVVGVLLGWYYILLVIQHHNTTISKKNIDDFISWVIVGIIIGGRLGYVMCYDPIKYLMHPIDILKTYEGGMSFHGGLVGFIGSAIIFCRINQLKFFALTDLCALVAPIAICLGRLANFINAELYGRPTDVPWSFIFPYSDGLPRHPSQLYEAMLEGIVLFCILRYIRLAQDGLSRVGMMSGVFLTGYAITRMLVEFVREPDVQVGYIARYFTMGQVLCIPMLVVGVYLMVLSKYQWQLNQK